MKLERAELRAAVQATEAAAEDTGGKVMDASFAEFLGILNGVDRMQQDHGHEYTGRGGRH